MRRFEGEIGFGRLRVTHVNDSKKDLGGRVDRHEQFLTQGDSVLTTILAMPTSFPWEVSRTRDVMEVGLADIPDHP